MEIVLMVMITKQSFSITFTIILEILKIMRMHSLRGGGILCKHNTTFLENTKKIIKMKIRNEEMFLYAKNPI